MVNKYKMFPPNELYTFKLDSTSISRVEYSIERTELANRCAKKTTRRHQNNKKLIRLEDELRRMVYEYNKFDVFDVISAELERQFSNLTLYQMYRLELDDKR